ncbi:MAG: hypothetical protein WA802_06215, partial [Terracidiphilus sp.]
HHAGYSIPESRFDSRDGQILIAGAAQSFAAARFPVTFFATAALVAFDEFFAAFFGLVTAVALP